MIRPMRDEVERYGPLQPCAESMYDHPFQWGRSGPGRIWPGWAALFGRMAYRPPDQPGGGAESIMPSYGFLLDRQIDPSNISDRLSTDAIVGVPLQRGDDRRRS